MDVDLDISKLPDYRKGNLILVAKTISGKWKMETYDFELKVWRLFILYTDKLTVWISICQKISRGPLNKTVTVGVLSDSHYIIFW